MDHAASRSVLVEAVRLLRPFWRLASVATTPAMSAVPALALAGVGRAGQQAGPTVCG